MVYAWRRNAAAWNGRGRLSGAFGCGLEGETCILHFDGEGMAQVPWQIVSRGPLEAPEALRQLRACYRSVRAAAAAAAGEGGAAASALLQHEDLGHLKAAHAALRKLLQVEAADTQAATASSCNTCFEQVRVR